jgi:cytoplasmic iron level regulating protein YaaA (DUF328/UPF0246 family)
MITILGPAKTITTDPHEITSHITRPEFLDDAEILIDVLKRYSHEELKQLMKISQKLVELNIERIAGWRKTYSPEESMQSLLAFSGEVFNGLQARTLKEEDLLFAQEHVRILSGLYGVLRPLDGILPYRLEIGTKLSNPRGKDLYAFWKDRIPPTISSHTEQQGGVLINLASNEYFSSIRPKEFPYRIITPVFKESDGRGFRNVTIYAKKARGMMLRYIITNRIDSPEEIKAFDAGGYYFNVEMSDENEWWFTR